MRAYIALFRSNMQLTLRDRSVLFFNYLFPFIFFFAFAELFKAGTGSGIAYFVGTVLTMGILGNGLWGAGMRSVQEREANILRRFKVTPITPLPILMAAMVSGWLLYLPVPILLIGLSHFKYGMPLPSNWISLFFMVSLGVCAFRAIGLILAAVTNTMQEAMIAIQLLYMPMLFLSGATMPSAILPKWAQTFAEFMPAAYLVTGFQGIFFRHQTVFDHGTGGGRTDGLDGGGDVSGGAALPLGEGRQDSSAQQAVGAGGARAVPGNGLLPRVQQGAYRPEPGVLSRFAARGSVPDPAIRGCSSATVR